MRAISFVGSTNVARHIYETGTAHGKRVQAAGGAKNHLIIMPDADRRTGRQGDPDVGFRLCRRALHGGESWPCRSGESPTMSSTACAAPDRAMKVGATDGGAEVDMGPLINAAHRDRVASYLDVARSEGAEVALDGRSFDLPRDGFLLGPSVVDRVRPDMRLAREEVFGPVLSVVRADESRRSLGAGPAMRLRQRGQHLHPKRLCRAAISSAISTPA